jgi:hypothetical protein
MTEKRRVPKEEGKFDLWYRNVDNNLSPELTALLNITAAERARITNDSTAWSYLRLRNAAVRAYKEEESKVKERAFDEKSGGAAMTLPTLTLPTKPDVVFNVGIWDWANNLVLRIVRLDACTPEIQALLGIEIKESESVSPDELKQTIKQVTALNGGVVKIKCSLMGKKSYGVYSQRGASVEFEHIGNSTESEFLDERPNAVAGQPEARKYKTICIENNKPVGEYSAVETIVTKP